MAKVISQADKMNMIQLGFSPLNPDHVKRYFAGEKPSLKEKQERSSVFYSDIQSDLGSSGYRDVMPTHSTYNETDAGMYSNNSKDMSEKDYRQSLREDMNDYVNTGSQAVNQLMSLNDMPQRSNSMQGQGLQEAANQARQLTVNYYNAFIQALKNPGFQTEMAVFNALKEKLTYEKKLQSNRQLLEAYRGQCNKVSEEMYRKLKG